MRTPSMTFKAGGTLKESNFYIERSADDELPAALLRGEFCYVLAPRQMGKSSLRYRVSRLLSDQHDVRCATVDLTGLGTGTAQAEDWYFGIVDDIARQIGDESLRTATEDFWVTDARLPVVQRFTRFLREVLLLQTTGRLVVFVDEIDAVRALPFSSDDFFAAVRAVYNARPDDPEYERLSICLLGVAQPGDLIRNEQITPFNIGTRIDLADFERPQLAPLESGLSATGANPARLLDAVFDWTCGHPYMVQSLCAALVPAPDRPQHIPQGTEAAHIATLVERLFLQRSGGRNPNLDYAEKCFQRGDTDPRVAKMLALYGQLIRGERIAADGRDAIQGALQLTGMIAPRRAGMERTLQVRNRIFATVFDAAWVKTKQSERVLSEPIHRWLESGRNDDFVLRGEALREAERWTDQRMDITSDEQEFLRACWRVQSVEERAKAETALSEARLAEAEKERTQATAQAQMRKRTNRLLGLMVVTLTIALIAVYSQYRRATKEEQAKTEALKRETTERARAEGLVISERHERTKAEQLAESEKAERARAERLAQEKETERQRAEQLAEREKAARASAEELADQERTQRARAELFAEQAQKERVNAEAKRDETDAERARAEQLTQAERGARAKLLTQVPGDVEALRVGLLAIGPSVLSGTAPLAQVVDGLTTAAQAPIYPLFTPWQHEQLVHTASFSPDGTRVVTTSYDGTARLWDARTGSSLVSLTGHSDWVLAASFSPDGTRVVTASKDGTARLWQAQTGSSLFTLKGHSWGVFAASFSPDGNRIVTASFDGTARLWDARTGSSLFTLKGHSKEVLAASFSPDGTRVVTASKDGTARLWDAKTGSSLFTLKGHSWVVLAASFSPDGTRVVTASKDGTARLWDAQAGSLLVTLKGHSHWVFAASFSSDGTRVVTASGDRTARLWDAQTGSSLVSLKGHSNIVVAASFSPDGTRVVTASSDSTARLWNAQTGSSLVSLKGHSRRVQAASFSSDGTRVVTASYDGTARLWDARTGSSLVSLKGHSKEVNAASFSSDGTRVVTASKDGTARLWDARTGFSLFTLKGHSDLVRAASFSPDGTRVVTASEDGTARLWDAQTGSSLFTLKEHSKMVLDGCFSPDGTRVVTTSADGSARLWDAQTGSSVLSLKGHSTWVLAARFSPDGTRVVTASSDSTARLWDARTGASLLTLKGHSNVVLTASFSPDGTRVVTTCADGTARLWDAKTGASLLTLKGHSDWVFTARFSPDGTRVVTASYDGTARLWDAKTGLLLITFAEHQGRVWSAAFSPSGEQIVTAGEDGLAYVYSTKLDFYIKRACELLRGHRAEFQDVTAVCQRVGVLPLEPIPSGIPMSQAGRAATQANDSALVPPPTVPSSQPVPIGLDATIARARLAATAQLQSVATPGAATPQPHRSLHRSAACPKIETGAIARRACAGPTRIGGAVPRPASRAVPVLEVLPRLGVGTYELFGSQCCSLWPPGARLPFNIP